MNSSKFMRMICF